MNLHEQSSPISVDIWSDIVCPWCAIGKAHLDEALQRFEYADDVEIRWHSFELDTAAPPVRDGEYVEALARKYGSTTAEAQGMVDTMTARAAASGMEFRFDRVRPGNTFDAHRLLHLAAERGLQQPLKDRFFTAYLTEGEAIGDREVLVRLAVEVGLDREEVAEVLATDGYAAAVRADEADARRLGVTGVPFFVFDGRYAVAGAQPANVLLDVLRRVVQERQPVPTLLVGGDVCGPDGCDVPAGPAGD